MIAWLGENLGTILVVLALAGIVFLIVRSMRKDKKNGRHVCGGDCKHCSAACGSCRQP
ncbi:MAG: FeoB-associated Cys-rich membrane protein [Oscillospiraceae bacterium]|nr:FeoB-associated Cys-rich membrane protein [Oscillospiraceae bacterium]